MFSSCEGLSSTVMSADAGAKGSVALNELGCATVGVGSAGQQWQTWEVQGSAGGQPLAQVDLVNPVNCCSETVEFLFYALGTPFSTQIGLNVEAHICRGLPQSREKSLGPDAFTSCSYRCLYSKMPTPNVITRDQF